MMKTSALKQVLKHKLSERQWEQLSQLVQAARSPVPTCLRAYFALRAAWPVWFYLLNREARRLYQENPPALAPLQKRVADEFIQHGIALTHLNELFPGGPQLLAQLQGYTQELIEKAETKTSKTFLRQLWDVTPLLALDNPFVKLALDENVLGIVAPYFQVYPKFYYLTLNVTTPVSAGAPPVQSQRWHRDPEDKKVCKVFLYLTDVDEDSGPFTYIPGSHYGGRWRTLFAQQPPRGRYPPAGAIERVVPPEAMTACTGKAGTIIFCDTSGLHRGGYATSKERLMFTAGYYSRASVWPRAYRDPAHLVDRVQDAQLGPFARYALQSFHHTVSAFLFRKFFKPQATYY